MADTDFANLPATSTIAAGDQILLVRNGAAYRFSGVLPAVAADGRLTMTVVSSAGAVVDVAQVYAQAGGAATARLLFGTAANPTNGAISAQTFSGTDGALQFWTATAGGLTQRLAIDPGGVTRPGADNAQSLGSASFRWSVIYGGTGTINTSDARAKQQVGPVPDEWLDAWADVEWVRYKFNDAVNEKGDEARWHVGLVAQQVRDAFAAGGLDALAIGLLCYDEWAAIPAVKAVTEKRNRDGEVTRVARPAVPAVPAGDRWGLRYDECQAIEAAYQRRRMARIEAQLAAIA